MTSGPILPGYSGLRSAEEQLCAITTKKLLGRKTPFICLSKEKLSGEARMLGFLVEFLNNLNFSPSVPMQFMPAVIALT